MEHVKDVVRQTLYDTVAVTVGSNVVSATTLEFFKVPMGQNSKTFLDTNIETAGMLPFEKATIVGMRFSLFTRTTSPIPYGDMYAFVNNAYMEFKKADRLIVREPIAKIPAGYGLTGAISTTASTTTSSIVNNGMALKSNVYDIFVEDLLQNDRLQVSVYLNALASLASSSVTWYARFEFDAEVTKAVR